MSFGMPFFLVDSSGSLVGSDFTDIHDRMRLSLRRTHHDSNRTAYMLYDLMNPARRTKPSVVLDFPRDGTAGFISLGDREQIPVQKYLGTTHKFVACDNQEYRWEWRQREQEWACVNPKGYSVASYAPSAEQPSNRVLMLEEPYQQIAVDVLTTLTIIRHLSDRRSN